MVSVVIAQSVVQARNTEFVHQLFHLNFLHFLLNLIEARCSLVPRRLSCRKPFFFAGKVPEYKASKMFKTTR